MNPTVGRRVFPDVCYIGSVRNPRPPTHRLHVEEKIHRLFENTAGCDLANFKTVAIENDSAVVLPPHTVGKKPCRVAFLVEIGEFHGGGNVRSPAVGEIMGVAHHGGFNVPEGLVLDCSEILNHVNFTVLSLHPKGSRGAEISHLDAGFRVHANGKGLGKGRDAGRVYPVGRLVCVG